MKIYLAGFKTIEKIYKEKTDDIYLLSSYWEHKNNKYGNYVTQKNHILDSGAFSMLNKKQNININKYVDNYIDFIKKTNQNNFFELDIYKIIGIDKTEDIRNKIEQATGKPCIPVWHKHLGIDYFNMLIENYNYIAIGGFALKDIKKRDYKYIPQLLKLANEKNCKVHGLGFTQLSLLKTKKFPFYSVDSTTWLVGGKYGNLCLFDKDGYLTQRYKKNNTRVKDVNKIHLFNFNQWIKFQKFANDNL
jgi:hypothetical protein